MDCNSYPECILFPIHFKIGLRQSNKLYFFKVGTIIIELSLTFPFKILCFSAPVDDTILVVDESRPTTLVVWNIAKSTVKSEYEFNDKIERIQCSKNFCAIITKTVTVIVKINPFSIYQKIKTNEPFQCFAISNVDINHCIVAYPDEEKPNSVVILTTPSSDEPVIVNAHKNNVSCLELSNDGQYLVTASVYGTIIRLWDTKNGNFIEESRRGWTSASIIHFSFSPSSTYLCITSNHGTTHICKIDRSSTNGNWLIPMIPKADISINLKKDSKHIQSMCFSSFVDDDATSLYCVTNTGQCVVYEIDILNSSAYMKSCFKLDKLMKLANAKKDNLCQ